MPCGILKSQPAVFAYTQAVTDGLRVSPPADSSGILAAMFSESFTLSKRQLGWLLLAGGVLAFAAIIAIDLVDAGREGGIGPAQQIALAAALAAALIGLTLIPLGDRPA
jgi:hypothetical protein